MKSIHHDRVFPRGNHYFEISERTETNVVAVVIRPFASLSYLKQERVTILQALKETHVTVHTLPFSLFELCLHRFVPCSNVLHRHSMNKKYIPSYMHTWNFE